jgi:hypothetical protein
MNIRTSATNQATRIMTYQGQLVECLDCSNGVDPNWEGLWLIWPLGHDMAESFGCMWHELEPVRMTL